MSKITIIPGDDRVVIDGVLETVVFTGNPNIHVVHWDEDSQSGTVEYHNKPAEEIDNFALYQHVIGEYGVSKAARLQRDQDAIDDRVAARTQTEKRWGEYPTDLEQLHALHEARQGDSTAIDAIDIEIIAIDLKYPL